MYSKWKAASKAAVLLAAMTSACGVPDSSPDAQLAAVTSVDNNSSSQLGGGYDSARNLFKTRCIEKPATTEVGTTAGQVEFLRRVDFATAEEKLNASLDIRARYMMVSSNVSVDAERWMKSDKYSETFIYMTNFELGGLALNPDGLKLNTIGTNALANGTWDKVCGDSIVVEHRLGASFLIVARFDFDSEQTKNDFKLDAEVGAGFGMASFSAKGKWKETVQKYNNRAAVSVGLFQIGGDPLTLGKALTGTVSGVDKTDEMNGVKALLNCNLNELENCGKFLEIAAQYAGSPASVPESFAFGVKGRPAIRSAVVKPWSEFPVTETIASPKTINGSILDGAQADLEREYNSYTETVMRVKQLLASNLAMPADYRKNLNKLQEDLVKTRQDIINAADTCYNQIEFVKESERDVQVPTVASLNNCVAKVDAIVIPQIAKGTLEAGGKLHIEYAAAEANLGSATGPLTATSDGRGYYQKYRDSTLVWRPDLGVVGLRPSFAERWLALGGSKSEELGWPTTGNGAIVNGGYFQEFQFGHLYLRPRSDTPIMVRGEIFKRWGKAGFENSFLGYPTGESYAYNGASAQNFDGGVVLSSGITSSAIPSLLWAKYIASGGSTRFGFPTNEGVPLVLGNGYYLELGSVAMYRNGRGQAVIIYGEIRKKWQAMDSERSFLGFPIEDEKSTADGKGRVSIFENGAIVYGNDTGLAIPMLPEIFNYREGHPWLGNPTLQGWTLVGNGNFTMFQNGSVYRTNSNKILAVPKDMVDAWGTLQWENGDLGYPTSEVQDHANGKIQYFERGVVVLSSIATVAMPSSISSSWLLLGGAQGMPLPFGGFAKVYGWPTSQGGKIRDGGFFTHFENDVSIYNSPRWGSFAISGKIRKEYAKRGWENGCLGYPKAAAVDKGNGYIEQAFENGMMKVVPYGSDAYQECKR